MCGILALFGLQVAELSSGTAQQELGSIHGGNPKIDGLLMFIMENPIYKWMTGLGVAPFQETSGQMTNN